MWVEMRVLLTAGGQLESGGNRDPVVRDAASETQNGWWDASFLLSLKSLNHST